jgi:hypothetical protein
MMRISREEETLIGRGRPSFTGRMRVPSQSKNLYRALRKRTGQLVSIPYGSTVLLVRALAATIEPPLELAEADPCVPAWAFDVLRDVLRNVGCLCGPLKDVPTE